jgi:hypothetical protein
MEYTSKWKKQEVQNEKVSATTTMRYDKQETHNILKTT